MVTSSRDDLGNVLFGKTRGAVLGLLLTRPDEEFHVRQVARLSGSGLGPVQRELKLLARVGVLKRREVGRQLLYRADATCSVLEELRGLILKTVGVAGMVAAALANLETRIRVAFLFGSFASGKQQASSDVDVMIIGDVSFVDVARALAEPQRQLAREVNPTVYRPAELASKIRNKHHFLTAVMAEPKVFLVGDEHELSRLAEEWMAAPPQDKPARGRGPGRGHRARPAG